MRNNSVQLYNVRIILNRLSGNPTLTMGRVLVSHSRTISKNVTTQFQAAVVVLDKARGPRRYGAFQAFFQHLQTRHMLASACLHACFGVGVGDGLDALRCKVAVTQPAGVLSTRVDHPLDGQRAYCFDRVVVFLAD